MVPGGYSAPKSGGLFLNDTELAQLQELMWGGYPMAYVLYVQELRRYMDSATGIVGDNRRVCEQGMRETLEREAKRGPNGAPKNRSRQFVQRQLSALEKYGLLQRLPKAGRFSAMRFYLPLAVPGSIRPQEMRTVMRAVKQTVGEGKTNVISLPCATGADKSEQQSEQQCEQHHVIYNNNREGGFSHEQLAAVDLQMVVACYHELLPGLPPVRLPTEGHRLLVARVWYMEPPGKHQTEAFWRGYFSACAKSDFLMGRVTPNLRKGPFRANFKSLVDQATVIKIINGEYT